MKRLVPFFALFLIVASCVTYNKMWVGPTSVFNDEEFKRNISKKEVFVHDSEGHQYSIRAPEINDTVLVGTFILRDSVEVKDVLQGQDLVKRNEVHVYLRDSIPSDKPTSMIHKDEVREIAIYEDTQGTKTDQKVLGGWVAILIIVLVGGFIGLILLLTELANSTAEAVSSCYIATMVYGSYDAPEVMTLRNFRDQVLKKYVFGRLFIGFYYWTSPKVVQLTKNSPAMNRFFKNRLDKLVKKLRSRGIE